METRVDKPRQAPASTTNSTAFPAHVQEAAESCYNVAANELLARIKMREQLLILNVSASLAIFGFAFRDHSPLLLLVAPHIAFGAVVLFEQQHSIIGAFFRYFEHLGESSRGEAGLPEDFQPWHASTFFVNHIAGGGIYERFVGRTFLFLGPPIGALIFAPLIQLEGEVNEFFISGISDYSRHWSLSGTYTQRSTNVSPRMTQCGSSQVA